VLKNNTKKSVFWFFLYSASSDGASIYFDLITSTERSVGSFSMVLHFGWLENVVSMLRCSPKTNVTFLLSTQCIIMVRHFFASRLGLLIGTLVQVLPMSLWFWEFQLMYYSDSILWLDFPVALGPNFTISYNIYTAHRAQFRLKRTARKLEWNVE
jgi:hypothetical protein